MARKYKIKTKNKGFIANLIPDFVKAFIARRIIDIVAGTLALVGLFITLSVISYNKKDPSFNSAGNDIITTQNWMGQMGANTSDILLQTFGLAGILLGLTLMVWGFNIFKRRNMPYFWSRIVALISGLFISSIALARVPAGDWLPQSYMGGSAGQLIAQNINDALHAVGIGSAYIIPALIFAAVAIITIGYAWAIRKAEAKYALSMMKFWTTSAVLISAAKITGFFDWVKCLLCN